MNLHTLTEFCNYFLRIATDESEKIVDISQQLSQKRIKREFEKAVPAPIPMEEVGSKDDLSKRREQKWLSEVQQKLNIWMHRFSDVRKDGAGFFILKTDNPAGNNMRPGELLADYAMNQSPYWKITKVDNQRISLEPIGSNPFLTGIGAGGAKLDKYDFDVFTGKAEQDRIEKIKQKLEDGTADIDAVKYVLDGTVPVNMGPNGAQGGWYNLNDRSSRGGRKGMKPEQIMIADAKKLQHYGFIGVPATALDGTMDPDHWQEWIEGSGEGAGTKDYIPKDIEKYIDFHRRMTQQGKWRYDEDAIKELYRKYSLEHLEEYWGQVVEDFTKMPLEEYKNKYKYYPETLKDIVSMYESDKRRLESNIKNQTQYFAEGEEATDESVIKNIFHKERRVAIRNTLKLIEMAKEDPKYIKYLHDMLKMGGAKDYLANEKVINFFDLIEDIDGLKLAAENLKDPTNLRYAYSALIRHNNPQFVLNNIGKNTPAEALGSVINSYRKLMTEDDIDANKLSDEDKIKLRKNRELKQKQYKNWIIDFVSKNDIFETIKGNYVPENVQDNYYNKELLSSILYDFRYLPNIEVAHHFGYSPEELDKYSVFAEETKKLLDYISGEKKNSNNNRDKISFRKLAYKIINVK